MSLEGDNAALKLQVTRMFERAARVDEANGNPRRPEQCLVAAKIYEYTSLEQATAAQIQDSGEKKIRIVIITRLEINGGTKFFVHKGRERPNQGMQIGRSWPLDNFSSVDVLTQDSPLLVIGFKKLYFWVFNSARSRHEFESLMRKIYYSITKQVVPNALTPPPVPQVSRRRTVSGRPRNMASPRSPTIPEVEGMEQIVQNNLQSPAQTPSPRGQSPMQPEGTQLSNKYSQQGLQIQQAQQAQQAQHANQAQIAHHAQKLQQIPHQMQQIPQQIPQQMQQAQQYVQTAANLVSPVVKSRSLPVVPGTQAVRQGSPAFTNAMTTSPRSYGQKLAQNPEKYIQNAPNANVAQSKPTQKLRMQQQPIPPLQAANPSQAQGYGSPQNQEYAANQPNIVNNAGNQGHQSQVHFGSHTHIPNGQPRPNQPIPREEPQHFAQEVPNDSPKVANIQGNVAKTAQKKLDPPIQPHYLSDQSQKSLSQSPVSEPKSRPVLPPLNVNFDNKNSLMSPLHSPSRISRDGTPNSNKSSSSNLVPHLPPQSAPPTEAPMFNAGSVAPLRPMNSIRSERPHPLANRSTPDAQMEIAVPQRSPSRSIKRMSAPQKSLSPEVEKDLMSPIKSPDVATNPHSLVESIIPQSATTKREYAHQVFNSPQKQPLLSPSHMKMNSLNNAIKECKWDGLKVEDLSNAINRKLGDLADRNFSGVVGIDKQTEEISSLLKSSLEEAESIDQKMQAVAMNLAGQGREVQHIEGQGDGLQVLTVSYRSLAQEVEKILACAQIDESFVGSFSSIQFGDPSSPQKAKQLQAVEHELKRLYKCLRMLRNTDDGGQPMLVLRRPTMLANKAAEDVGNLFIDFLVSQIKNLDDKSSTYERDLFNKFYIYSGCALFLQNACPEVFNSLLKAYEKSMQGTYNTQSSMLIREWTQKLDSIVSGLPAQNFLSSASLQQDYNESQSATLGQTSGHAELKSLKMPPAQQDRLFNLMQGIVDRVCLQVSSQRQFIVQFFHLGTESGLSFLEYTKRYPLPTKRVEYALQLEDELSNCLTLKIPGVPPTTLENVFIGGRGKVAEFLESIIKKVPLESPYLLVALDYYNNILRGYNQQFLADLLKAWYIVASNAFNQFVKEQTKIILGAHFVTKKRVGINPVVTRFTEYVSIVENSYRASLAYQKTGSASTNGNDSYQCTESRELIDKGHLSIFRAISQGLRIGADTAELLGSVSTAAKLKAVAKETAAGNTGEEAKVLLNRHVVMVENLYGICEEFNNYTSPGLREIVKDAKHNYNRELESYIADVISRPLNKVLQFVHNNESKNLQQLSKQKDVSSQLKRTFQGVDSKEIRKGIENLRKRVEKHFMEASGSTVLESVWRAIGVEYCNVFDKVMKIAKNVDGTGYLQFQRSDITNAFL